MAPKKKTTRKKTTRKRVVRRKPKKSAVQIHVDVPMDKMREWKTKDWCWGAWHGPAKWGVSFGSALAMILSYDRNASILWAILHGILSWLYVLYVAAIKIGWF